MLSYKPAVGRTVSSSIIMLHIMACVRIVTSCMLAMALTQRGMENASSTTHGRRQLIMYQKSLDSHESRMMLEKLTPHSTNEVEGWCDPLSPPSVGSSLWRILDLSVVWTEVVDAYDPRRFSEAAQDSPALSPQGSAGSAW